MFSRRSIILASILAAAAACAAPAACCAPAASGTETTRAEDALAAGDTTAALELLEKRAHEGVASSADYARLAGIYRSRGGILDRLASQRLLEEALRARPDDADLLVALGETYFDQGFFGDAERTFSRVLSLSPGRCEAHEYLGLNAYRKWKHVQLYTDHLHSAVPHLRRAVECSPDGEEVYFKLAFSAYMLGDTALVRRACREFRERRPGSPQPWFLGGVIAFEESRWEDCRRCFDAAMDLLEKEDRAPYMDIRVLLVSADAAARYDEASAEAKETMVRLYWLEHDPDPTTEVNERLLEHIARVFLADARFGMERPRIRGWETERGKAFIKFGPPTRVRTTLEGRSWDGRSEIWTYVAPPRSFALVFRDEFLNGNYIVPMHDAISAQTLSNAPPETRLAPEPASLDAVVDLTSFRQSDTTSVVLVSFAVVEDTLQRRIRTWDIREFTSRTSFFTEDGQPVAYHTAVVPVDSLPPHPVAAVMSRRFTVSYELPFGAYRVAHSFSDSDGLAASLLWSSTNTLRFLGDSLSMSDILLHLPAEGPRAARSAGEYSPYPEGRYLPPEKLRLYVEMYNLKIIEGATSFEIAYSIHRGGADGGAWKTIVRRMRGALNSNGHPAPVMFQSFQRAGFSDTAAEDLVIDIAPLEPGEYVLSARVLDRNSGARASRTKSFTIIGRAD